MSVTVDSSYRFDLSDIQPGERLEVVVRPVTRGGNGSPRRIHKRTETFHVVAQSSRRLGKFCDADYCLSVSGDGVGEGLLRDDRRLIEQSGTEWHVDEVRWLGG